MTANGNEKGPKTACECNDLNADSGSTQDKQNGVSQLSHEEAQYLLSMIEPIRDSLMDESGEPDEAELDKAFILLMDSKKVSNLTDRAMMLREAMALDPNLVTGCLADFAEAIEGLEKEDCHALLTEVFRNHSKYPSFILGEHDPSSLLVNGPVVGEDAHRLLETIKTEMPDCPLKEEYFEYLPRIIALREEGLDFDTRPDSLKLSRDRFPRYLRHRIYDPKRYSVLADELYEIGAIEESNRWLKLAVRLEPKKSSRRVRLVGVLIDAGEYEAALSELQHELKLDDDYADYLATKADELEEESSEVGKKLFFTLIKLLGEHGNTEEYQSIKPMIEAALTSLSQSEVELDETNADSLWAYAVQMELAEKLPEAIQYVLKAREISPENGDMQGYLGRLYVLNGQYHKALEPMNRAVEIYPDNEEYRYWLGRSLEKAGRHEEALEQYEIALELDESDARYADMVKSLLILERLEEVDEKLEMARRLAPEKTRYTAFQALNAGRMGDDEKATSLAEDALHKANKDTLVFDIVASLFSLMGDRDRALKVIEQAITLEPDNEALLETFDRINRRIPVSADHIITKLRN